MKESAEGGSSQARFRGILQPPAARLFSGRMGRDDRKQGLVLVALAAVTFALIVRARRGSSRGDRSVATTAKSLNHEPEASVAWSAAQSRRETIQHGLALAWRLGSRWWVVAAVLLFWIVVIFAVLWFGHDFVVSIRGEEPYFLRDLLAGGADIALKLGAVVGGLLAIYRYWYQRYEPLVYFATCSPMPKALLEDLRLRNAAFAGMCRQSLRISPDRQMTDEELEQLHNLPMVVVHRTMMESIGVSEGSQVDLRFETPEGRAIWAIAFVFSFDSAEPSPGFYANRQIALSLSLRRYFGIERPFNDLNRGRRRVEQAPPEGWQRVEVYAAGYAMLHGTTRMGNKLVWIARDDYSVRFRDPRREVFYTGDDPGPQRVLEYVGVSLRVFRRSALRYRAE